MSIEDSCERLVASLGGEDDISRVAAERRAEQLAYEEGCARAMILRDRHWMDVPVEIRIAGNRHLRREQSKKETYDKSLKGRLEAFGRRIINVVWPEQTA